MRIRITVVWLTLVALVWTSPAWAQQHVADAATMHQAVAARVASDAANRDVVLKTLDRDDVRQMAATLGVDLKDARSAVTTMTSDQLDQLAQASRAIEADQAAGANVVVISVTTLLLLLILIVLIAK